MKEIWTFIRVAFTALGGAIGWFIGGADGLVYALLVFVIVDYVTGVMCAVRDRELSSAVGFVGICKKILIFLLVGIGHIIDLYIIGNGAILRTACIFFYISNEGISIIENAARMGLPVPQKLVDVLKQLKNEEEEN